MLLAAAFPTGAALEAGEDLLAATALSFFFVAAVASFFCFCSSLRGSDALRASVCSFLLRPFGVATAVLVVLVNVVVVFVVVVVRQGLSKGLREPSNVLRRRGSRRGRRRGESRTEAAKAAPAGA